MRLGVIGLSPENGHPFSFSAIVNGFDEAGFEAAGWGAILDYLKREPASAFGFDDVRVTHAWTQDPPITRHLCQACRIEHAVERLDDMVGAVDAVLLARDDWERHAEMAMPFLEHGTAVFIDKPLSLDAEEIERFRPFLEEGRLMSTSGLRYARELGPLRERREELGDIRLLDAVVLNGMEKYGIHMLDAASGLGLATPVAVSRIPAAHQAFSITLADGAAMTIHCLGAVAKTFHISLFGTKGHRHFDLHDNFAAFRETIRYFLQMVRDQKPPVPSDETVRAMTILRIARDLEPGQTIELPNS